MTDLAAELVSSASAAETIRDLAFNATEVETLHQVADRALVLGVPTGVSVQTVDLSQYADTPVRKTGNASHFTGTSLAAYINAHKLPDATALYADTKNHRLVAILDGHLQRPGDSAAGWAGHRASLQVRKTPEWEHWLKYDGRLLPQTTFAEHIEDGQAEITDPPAATMLELAESFQATSKVDFESASRLADGQRQLVYSETTQAKAGRKGSIDIPKEFVLGVAPFEGSDPYRVTALLRYRIADGTLTIGYKLVRPADVELHAFTDVVTAVETNTELTAYRGTPPA